ncbi:MAG: hypothetical protein LBL91_04105 [Lachnospiraceae bacterium]|jgi:hypothetical protein|nr:hypothetical protein [Lachnospiraceae bacterium]
MQKEICQTRDPTKEVEKHLDFMDQIDPLTPAESEDNITETDTVSILDKRKSFEEGIFDIEDQT